MAETYNPQIDGTVFGKPLALVGVPDSRRSEYADEVNFLNRAFLSTTEAIEYYETPFKRQGRFVVIVNDTGVLQPDGTILGGTNQEYWWRDGVEDEDLILKVSSAEDVAPTPSDESFIIV